MTHLDNLIISLKQTVKNNSNSAARWGVPEPYTISHLEHLIFAYEQSASADKRTMSGTAAGEAGQLLNNLKRLKSSEEENKHLTDIQLPAKITYNFSSIYGTFSTEAETEPQAYSMFLDWLEQKENQVTPEPTPVIIEPEIEIKDTWWVIRPSGLIEQLTVTQKFKDTMTIQGWIFSKEKPTIEEPQNQNISIVFYIGKGGDLKTHFGINSIIVTPDEADQLAGWLYQNYNTKILFVMNRLTNDIRTHTQQQLKELIVQKLKDDEPESNDITKEDIKKPQQAGILGAGVAGAIGLLILGGFLIDSRRKK